MPKVFNPLALVEGIQKLKKEGISDKEIMDGVRRTVKGKFPSVVMKTPPSLAPSTFGSGISQGALKTSGATKQPPIQPLEFLKKAPAAQKAGITQQEFKQSFAERIRSRAAQIKKERAALKGAVSTVSESQFVQKVSAGIKGGIEKGREAGEAAYEAGAGIDVETGKKLSAGERIIKGGESVFKFGSGVLQTAFAPMGAAITEIPVVGGIVEKGFGKFREGSDATGIKFAEALGIDPESEQGLALREGVNFFADATLAKGLEKGGELVKAPVSKALGKGKEVAGEIIGKGKQVAGEVLGKGKGLITKAKETAGETIPKILEPITKRIKAAQKAKIETKIQPKPTKGEVGKALEEGRVVESKTAPGLGEKPTAIKPSTKVQEAADVLQKHIPKAEKLPTSELIPEINNAIKKIAEQTKASAKDVKVTPKQTAKLDSSWGELKAKQLETADLNVPGIKQMQTRFENFLDKVKQPVKDASGKFRGKNLNDTWDIAKAYDKAIPENIKASPTPTTNPSTVAKHTMWLQNRGILRDLIKDQSVGLGDVARNAFNEMSALYEAKVNLKSTFKIDPKGTKGLISKALKLGKKGAKVLTGGALAGAGFKIFGDD